MIVNCLIKRGEACRDFDLNQFGQNCRVLTGGKMLKLPFPSVRYFFFVAIFSAVAVKATSELELRAVSMES